MRLYIKCTALIGLFLLSCTALGATPQEQVSNLLSNFHSMSANFEQSAIVKKGAGKRSSGTMALQRPGKFRWEVMYPNHQIIVADGKSLWIYDVDLEQATKQSLTKDSTSPASLLSGSAEALQQRYTITGGEQGNGEKIFKLKPKSNTDMIQWIELQFKDDKIRKISVIDNLGQKTIFYFSVVRINPSLSKNLFQFKAPKGVDILQSK